MNFKIIPIKEMDNNEKIKIDEFILDKNTNGEFINTIKYLSYHKTDRFQALHQEAMQDYENMKMRVKRQMNMEACYGGSN